MPLPASMICLTASGASSGGSATPLPKATALSTALEPPDAGLALFSAPEACLVGLASVALRPGSAVASVVAPAAPATGATDRARDSVGSGGSDTASSVGTGVATSGVDVAAAA